MVAEGKEYSHYGRCQHPPFLLPLVKEQSQEEQEYADGSHVHRTSRERLRTPVIWHPLRCALAILLEQFGDLRLCRIHDPCGRASVEIRNHQVRQFLPTVGPGSGIIQLQAILVDLLSDRVGKFGTSTHRVFGIFIQRCELYGICAYSCKADDQQEGGGCEEPSEGRASFLGAEQRNCKSNRIDRDHYREVICDLLVVGLDLEAQRQSEQNRTQESLRKPALPPLGGLGFQCLPVSEHHRSKHPRKECQCLHLGVVTHLDDLQVIRAEGHGDGSSNGQELVYSERQHKQEGSQQGNEQPGGRPFPGHQQVVQSLGPVPFGRWHERSRRHSSEH